MKEKGAIFTTMAHYTCEMRNPQQNRSVLSNQNAVPLLIYLYENNGSAKSSHIMEAVPNFNSIKNVGEKLRDAGLISITECPGEQPGRRNYIQFKLTETGFEVAKHLKKAEDALKGLPSDDFIPASGSILSEVKEKRD